MTLLTIRLEKAAQLLSERLGALEERLQDGYAATWREFAEVAAALASVLPALAPQRSGELMTTREMAEKLGIAPKTLLKRKARGEIRPALVLGRRARRSGGVVPRCPGDPVTVGVDGGVLMIDHAGFGDGRRRTRRQPPGRRGEARRRGRWSGAAIRPRRRAGQLPSVLGEDAEGMKRKLPRKKRLKLWHAVDVAISRGDLVLCGADDFVWFADPADAMTPELGQLLCWWKVELTHQLCKGAAAKARGERRAP